MRERNERLKWGQEKEREQECETKGERGRETWEREDEGNVHHR